MRRIQRSNFAISQELFLIMQIYPIPIKVFANIIMASMSNVYIWSCYLGGTDFTGADINGIQS